MANVLLIILLILSIVLVGLILIQRSEGGALGIGGGGGAGGGFMSGRGTADMVQKLTAWLGAAFLGVCLLISISFNFETRDNDFLDDTNAVAPMVQTPAAENTDSENKGLNEAADSSKDTTPLDNVVSEPKKQATDADISSQDKDKKPE